MKIKRAIIFLHGDHTDTKFALQHIRPTDTIICADGGAEHVLKLGLIPHVIIGDMDSLSNTAQKKLAKHPITWLRFPPEKDATDSELALTYALDKKYKTILIFGLLGARLDHLLSNIFLLTTFLRQNIAATIIEGNQEIRLIQKSMMLKGNAGDLVSVLPVHTNATGVTLKGLKYVLNDYDIALGSTIGISNVFVKKKAEIIVREGLLLVIHTKLYVP